MAEGTWEPCAHARAPAHGLGWSGARVRTENLLCFSGISIISYILIYWNPTAVLLYRSYVPTVSFKKAPQRRHNHCKAQTFHIRSNALESKEPLTFHCLTDAKCNCHTSFLNRFLPYRFLFYQLCYLISF